MAVMRLAAVAFGVAVAAAAVVSPVAAKDADGVPSKEPAPFPPVMGDLASMNATSPADGDPLGMVTTFLSEAMTMGRGSGAHDRDHDSDGMCESLSVRDDFFSVPEPFPSVDGEELMEAIEKYLEALPALLLGAALTPVMELAEKGVLDSWLVAARRGLFDQLWYAVNVGLGLFEEVLQMSLDALKYFGEVVDEANKTYLAFRQGELDDAVTSPRDVLDSLMDDVLPTTGRMAAAASSGNARPLDTSATRAVSARARFLARVGRGPVVAVRRLDATYRQLSAGGVAGMKARVAADAAKPFTPRFRSTHA